MVVIIRVIKTNLSIHERGFCDRCSTKFGVYRFYKPNIGI